MLRNHFFDNLIVLFVLLSGGLMAGCGGDAGGAPPVEIEKFVSKITLADGDTAGVVHAGALPTSRGDLSVVVPASRDVINGGSTLVRVSGDAVLTKIFVGVEGVDGHWEVGVSDAALFAQVLLTLGQELPLDDFSVLFQVGDEAGNVSKPSPMHARVHEVGTGDIQVSISWDALNDIDLHVIDPNDFEISYYEEVSPEGGELDLDSNADCGIDGVNNENIRWASGTAPAGEYTVKVDNYLNCSGEETHYVVTVQSAGEEPRTFTGGFDADDPGDEDAEGSGTVVTAFTFP